MTEGMAEIAIIGAGPAGAFLASRLAEAGREVVLFDPKGAWEKPCGGGVPTRALREYAALFDGANYPRKLIRRVTLISPIMRRITIDFDEPFAIYSRQMLNGLVLDRALESGARFVRAAVSDFKRDGEAWQIKTGDGQRWRAGFLVGADGAASATRRKLVGIFPKQDLALAFGYNVTMSDGHCAAHINGNSKSSGPPAEGVVQLLREFTGYVWAFPRPGVMNFGVASKLGKRTSDELRSILKRFVADYFGGQFPEAERLSFFGAKIPTLDYASWQRLQTVGDGWALVGDAAGFADPITGEGIYYALRSADLLAADLLASPAADVYHAAATQYEQDWRAAFRHDLERAARRLPLFYRGRFCGRRFTDAMILLAKYHRGVRRVLVRAVVGYQSYATLKRELLRSVLRVF